jgi:two-component system sensor histidine kinase/response regulator
MGLAVLVADDNEVNRLLAIRQLQRLGHTATAVSDGHEAIDAARSGRYALILMDCQMPGLDGFEATRVIRSLENEGASTTPIVAMTAYAMEGDRERCLEAGMNDYLPKPVELEVLRTTIDRWTGSTYPDPDDPDLEGSMDQGTTSGAVDRAALDRVAVQLGRGTATEVLEEYLGELDTRISAIVRALGRGDLEAVGDAAHTLLGTSSLIGATELARLCSELEKAAQHERIDMGTDHGAAIEAEGRRVRDAIGSLSGTSA